MKLIDETKEKVKDILEDYFWKKQGEYDYKGSDLELDVKDCFKFRLEEVLRELDCLEKEIDELLENDQVPTKTEMINAYDAWRENELANERR